MAISPVGTWPLECSLTYEQWLQANEPDLDHEPEVIDWKHGGSNHTESQRESLKIAPWSRDHKPLVGSPFRRKNADSSGQEKTVSGTPDHS